MRLKQFVVYSKSVYYYPNIFYHEFWNGKHNRNNLFVVLFVLILLCVYLGFLPFVLFFFWGGCFCGVCFLFLVWNSSFRALPTYSYFMNTCRLVCCKQNAFVTKVRKFFPPLHAEGQPPCMAYFNKISLWQCMGGTIEHHYYNTATTTILL